VSPRSALRQRLAAELARPAPAAVRELAQRLAQRAGGATASVLFYGSALREDALDGVLDFYLLLDDVAAWPGPRLAALANRWLPPNVGYFEGPVAGRTLRAKFALLSRRQFSAGMSPRAIDTTLWARFSQPCIEVYSRSADDQAATLDAVQAAVHTATRWAAELGPECAAPADWWRALYARTYVAELRVEKAARGLDLVSRDETRYAELLPLAWASAGLRFESRGDGALVPELGAAMRASALRRWNLRQRLGKPLNLLRLVKAAFTFENAVDYVAWKVERHSGYRLHVSDWQRRHPVLAAPGVYRELKRKGVIR
jgi:hypothetical protein